jgi:hypothetical protein
MMSDMWPAPASSGGIDSVSQYSETPECHLKKENMEVNMKMNTKSHVKMNRTMKENMNECDFGHECGDVWKEKYGLLTRR